ncbi:vacuolar protein-sorting-associated protein 36 [Condylostylus longicornis]|uniref:vacuolar protein-sorting-associated protein 36 n=1 Tax=Condylostylus longicornis TaxID=2530218 RepID=UPI00244E4EF0|nr:vacuolar protein-sorting-associated protein 36 [Condylostylus longicornis]
MNRFEYVPAKLQEDESFVGKHDNIKIYNGHEKTHFEDGEVVLTTHRLFWGKPGQISRGEVILCLHFKYVVGIDEEQASSFIFGKKTRVIFNLRPPLEDKTPGPFDSSSAHFIKLSGRHGLAIEFIETIKETINARIWEIKSTSVDMVSVTQKTEVVPRIKLRTGITGIERSIVEKQKQTDESIAAAFQDLKVLMTMAKEMVGISKAISQKIKERKGEISEDETVKFKSYLMSLGIDDPVTRNSFASTSEYYKSLSNEICGILLDPIEEIGGMMSLADAYCRINRARGLELLSPEDVLDSCRLLNGPIKLRQFPSGAMVLELESQEEKYVSIETAEKVEEHGSLSVEELAKLFGISMILSRERLLAAERNGKICRDESIEGLRYYPNLFLR